MFKPALAGVRILSLDRWVGTLSFAIIVTYCPRGGIRGIAVLEVLQHTEEELGEGIPIQDFFDLIVGTRQATSYIYIVLSRLEVLKSFYI